jgi:CRP-like cAMP-binding protein
MSSSSDGGSAPPDADWLAMLRSVFVGELAPLLPRFLEKLEKKTFADGAVLVAQGARGDGAMFILESGCVAVEEAGAGLLTRLHPGAHFGEFSLVRDQPRLARYVARRAAPCPAPPPPPPPPRASSHPHPPAPSAAWSRATGP